MNISGVRRPPPRRDVNTQGAAIEPLVYSHPNEGVVFSHPIEPLFRQSEANQGVEQREGKAALRVSKI
jgi:hypothetical protein